MPVPGRVPLPGTLPWRTRPNGISTPCGRTLDVIELV